MQINAYEEGTKINNEVNERPFKEYWYALEDKAPLISTSTHFLQPSQRISRNYRPWIFTEDVI